MADADTIYRVLTVYDVDTSKGERGLGSFATVLDHTINLLKEAKNVVSEMVKHLYELDSSAESAQIAMAGLMNAANFPGASDFNQSMKMSSELMKIMRHDAAALSGTYEQMQAIFQAVIPVAHEAGQSLMSAEKLTGKVMEFGNTFNIPAEFIGREFRQMMEGRASNRNALFKDLSMFMGNMSGQDFNALGSAEKWQKVNEALSHFDPMFKRVGDTAKAQLSTLESYWNNLLRIGSGAMFDGLKGALKEINEWYAAHQKQIDDIAKKLGDELAEKIKHGFTVLREVVGFIIDHRDTLIQVAEAIAAAYGFSKLTGGHGFGAGAGKAIGTIGNMAVGGGFGYSMAILTGTTDLVNKSLMVTEGAFSQLPGVVGQVSTALLGLHSALQYFADKIDERQGKNIKDIGDLGDPSSILNAMGRDGIDTAGPLMRGFFTAHGLLKDGALNNGAMNDYMNAAVGTGVMSREQASQFRDLALQSARAGYFRKHAEEAAEFGPGLSNAALTPDQKIQQLLYEAGKHTEVHNTQIGAIYMYNNIYDAEDSARVVQRLASDLKQNIEHPRQSPSAPQFGR